MAHDRVISARGAHVVVLDAGLNTVPHPWYFFPFLFIPSYSSFVLESFSFGTLYFYEPCIANSLPLVTLLFFLTLRLPLVFVYPTTILTTVLTTFPSDQI